MNISYLYRIKAFRSLIQSAEHIKLNTDVSKTKYRMLKDMFDTLIYGSKTNLSIEKYKFHGSNRRFTEYDNKKKLLYHSQIRKQIANKTLKGTRLKLPLGYSQDQDGIIKIDSNAFVVHLIFQVFMNTKSIAAIRDKLFKFNFPLNEDKIKGILTKSFYSGVIEIDDERFPCDHFIEPIISRSDFASIQDIFAIRRSRVSESAITNFPLSAFVEDVSTHKNYIGDADLTSAGPPKQYSYRYKLKKEAGSPRIEASFFHNLFEDHLVSVNSIDSHLIQRFLEEVYQVIEPLIQILSDELQSELTEISTDDNIASIPINLINEFNERIEILKLNIRELSYFANSKNFMDLGIDVFQNMSMHWADGGYVMKRELQKLVFPDGILYDPQKTQFINKRIIFEYQEY